MHVRFLSQATTACSRTAGRNGREARSRRARAGRRRSRRAGRRQRDRHREGGDTQLLPERELRSPMPTTYASAEWTPYYGCCSLPVGRRGGGASGRPVAAIYDPELTVSLPVPETVGTAMNALAHCAEACAASVHRAWETSTQTPVPAIAYALPLVCVKPDSIARTRMQAPSGPLCARRKPGWGWGTRWRRRWADISVCPGVDERSRCRLRSSSTSRRRPAVARFGVAIRQYGRRARARTGPSGRLRAAARVRRSGRRLQRSRRTSSSAPARGRIRDLRRPARSSYFARSGDHVNRSPSSRR